MSKKFYAVATLAAGIVIAMATTYACSGSTAQTTETLAAPPVVSPTDLVVGQVYKVADLTMCMSDGDLRYEWHFGGADRSLRNQQTPDHDGRGRKILYVVTDDADLPEGHMRLRVVTEHVEDPVLEGFDYGSYEYHWEGIIVEYNGDVSYFPMGICGPARS